MRSRTRRGVVSGKAPRSAARVITCASVSGIVSALKRCWPVSISCNTTPKAQMSARLSTDLPFACSGAM